MPQHAAPKKSVRQDKKRRMRNKSVKTNLKSTIKKVSDLIKNGNSEEAQKLFKMTISKIDKAASRKIIHKRKASREKSHLSHSINALGGSEKKETTA